MTDKRVSASSSLEIHYDSILEDISKVIDAARKSAARSVNCIMTAAYWLIGHRIVELEQKGEARAEYGEELIERLAADLIARYGRGFSVRNVWQMKAFYLAWPIPQTVSAQSEGLEILQTVSAESVLSSIVETFPLPWSAYVRLLSVKNENARRFYEAEALRGGWSVRQLDRQINSQFYERVALSREKAAMLEKAEVGLPENAVTPEAAIKDPYVLEFLNLKDEYSESDLEEALIQRLEDFLLELGDDFAFIGRQRRLRVGDEWYRVDLLFFHRRLRALIVIDLKIGKFTHADAGRMHLYLNYAREHWANEGENPPVGLILCAQKDAAVVHYALEGLPNKVLAAEYRTTLPDEAQLAEELVRARRLLESRRAPKGSGEVTE
ncbi:MAG: PDDEXK nuclease domain-containing protein [Syntrophobacteraceae bacterium]